MPSGKRLIDKITDELRLARHDWRERQGRELDLGSRELPSHQAVHQTVDTLCAILFPMRLGPPDLTKEREDQFVAYMLGNVERELVYQVALELQYLDRGQQALVALRSRPAARSASCWYNWRHCGGNWMKTYLRPTMAIPRRPAWTKC